MERITHAMRAQYWAGVVKECNESRMKKKVWLAQHNISEKAFYKWQQQHNISEKAFYKWQQKLRVQVGTDLILSEVNKPALDIAELKCPVPAKPQSSVQIEKDGITINLNEDISDAMLVRIMRALSNV